MISEPEPDPEFEAIFSNPPYTRKIIIGDNSSMSPKISELSGN